MSAGGGTGVLSGRRILVTGIASPASLALPIAEALRESGGELVCAGLGPTAHHHDLSAAARRYLAGAQQSFESVVHAVAMDRTIRGGAASPLLQVTRDEFLDCMSASAYSLLALVRVLVRADVLRTGASIVALSYLGAERVMSHPYRNIGVAKAALERLVRELAAELGPAFGMRVNAVRFSPWSKSRAGGAIPGLEEAMALAARRAPLGNADTTSLAHEVIHLLRPELAVTGEVRHVDGGYHVVG